MDHHANRTTVPSGIGVSGEMTAAEDVTIYGRVEGRLTVPEHDVTVTKAALVAARIVARTVLVSGTVDGNILAAERIHLLASASVRGHLTTSSLVLDDGAQFTGTVDPDRTEAGMRVARYRERRGR